MTVPYVPPERSWGEVLAHVLLRLLLVLVGYLTAVLITLVATVILYAILSRLPNAPSYFGAMSVTPVLAIVLPHIGGLIFLVAVVLSFVPALALALLAEVLSLRSPFLHMLFGAGVSAGTFAFSAPTLLEGNGPITDWRDALIMAGGGIVGGIAYWLIAGRNAGFRQPPP